jgi:hypothetical protein
LPELEALELLEQRRAARVAAATAAAVTTLPAPIAPEPAEPEPVPEPLGIRGLLGW